MENYLPSLEKKVSFSTDVLAINNGFEKVLKLINYKQSFIWGGKLFN